MKRAMLRYLSLPSGKSFAPECFQPLINPCSPIFICNTGTGGITLIKVKNKTNLKKTKP